MKVEATKGLRNFCKELKHAPQRKIPKDSSSSFFCLLPSSSNRLFRQAPILSELLPIFGTATALPSPFFPLLLLPYLLLFLRSLHSVPKPSEKERRRRRGVLTFRPWGDFGRGGAAVGGGRFLEDDGRGEEGEREKEERGEFLFPLPFPFPPFHSF